jgi:hypothetical protein
LAFPFAIVEVNAYSTGEQIFEAENQTSVAGACGLKIQLDLDNVVEHDTTDADTSSQALDTNPPLVFLSVPKAQYMGSGRTGQLLIIPACMMNLLPLIVCRLGKLLQGCHILLFLSFHWLPSCTFPTP